MRNDRCRWAAAALVLGLSLTPAQASARDAVVDEVIQLARANALNRDVPDWAVVEQEAQGIAEASPGEDGRTAAIRHVLRSLRDHHSSYRPPVHPVHGNATSMPATGSAPRPIAVADVRPGRPGTLTINPWQGNAAAIPGATQTVRTELNKALAGSTCGIVLDVSANVGGNMWPMMGGIAPLYDEGVLETFESADGVRATVSVEGGVLRSNGSPFPRADLAQIAGHPKRIAVVVGGRTASSGEILALGFKGQRNVRFFGQRTAGATTSNRSIRLSNGGHLALTTSRILDRTGSVHMGPVQPDVVTDDASDEAADWVMQGCD